MKKSVFLKLCMLMIVASMVLSLFACGDDSTATTEAPEQEFTEDSTSVTTEGTESANATTEATTSAKTETTEAPVTTTTEAPATVTTEAPTTETTEESTTETTEPTYPPVIETVTSPKTEAGYYLVMIRENPDKTLFLNGEMDGYYYGTTENMEDGIRVYLEGVPGGFNMYTVVNSYKIYLNIVKNGTYTNVVYDKVASSVWNYDETLGTLVTECDGTNYFLGTRNDKDYTTISACDVQYTDNYKAKLSLITYNGEPTCEHVYVSDDEGHWKPACSICGKERGVSREHDFTTVQYEGTEYVTHSVECSLCFYVQMSFNIPANVNKYLGTDYISDRTAGVTFQMSEEGRFVEGDIPYVRFSGNDKTGQIIWTRIGLTEENLYPDTQVNPVDVGDASYLIIKMRRIGAPIYSLVLGVGTIEGEASNANWEKQKVVQLHLPQNNMVEGEWTYFVLDLSTTWKDGWIENGEGNHTVTFLQYTFNSTEAQPFGADTKFDIAYMAFVSDWNELGMIVDADAVELVDASKSSVTVSTQTGKCVSDHSPEIIVDGEKYTHICKICGETVLEQTIPASINKYINPVHIKGLSHYQVGESSVVYEDDFYYLHTVNNMNNHTHIWTKGGGAGQPTALGANSGKYLVMKFRTDNMDKISLGIHTGDKSYGYKDRKWGTDGQWETVVLDLSQFTSYSTDQDSADVLIRINGFVATGSLTPVYTLDIAYVAIVDDLSEAALIIDEETYDYYSDWTVAGVKYDTATGAPALKDETTDAPATESTEAPATESTEAPATESTETPATESTEAPVDEVVDYDFTPNEIKTSVDASSDGTINATVDNDNGIDFVHLVRTEEGNAPGFYLKYNEVEGNSGKYLIFKYRTNLATGWQALYSSTQNASHNANDLCWTTLNGDGNWHVFIVDMEANKQITKSFVDDGNGNFKATYVWFTLFYQNKTTDVYFDLAYVTWAETPDEAHNYVGEGEDILYGYCDGAKWIPYTYEPSTDDNEGTTEAPETDTTVSTNYYNDFSDVTSLNHSTLTNQTENGVNFTKYFSDGSEASASNAMNFILVTGPGGGGYGTPTTESVVWGKYLIFKVRQSGLANINIVIGTDNSNRGTTGAMTVFPGGTGEWGVAVIDLSTVSTYTVGNNAPLYIRIVTTTQTAGNYSVDFAYIAMVDELTEVEAFVTSNGDTGYTYYGTDATTTAPEVKTVTVQ